MSSIDYAPNTEKQIFDKLILKKRDLVSTEGLKWTTESPTDYGIGLLRLFAYGLSLAEDFVDNRATQNYLIYAIDDEPCHASCRQIGYKMRGPISSKILLNITASGAASVPAGSEVYKATSTGAHISFEIIDDVVFTEAGTKQVYAIQGKSYVKYFTGDNTEYQEVVIDKFPIAYSSLAVVIGSYIWSEVNDFVNSGPTSKHYIAEPDYKGQIKIIFGDGINGMKPLAGAQGVVGYRICDGAVGNIAPGAMNFTKSYSRITGVTNQAPAEAILKYDISSSVSEIEVVNDNSIISFADSGVAYIDEDSFTYTSISGNKFMGVSGLEYSHAAEAKVIYSNKYTLGQDSETNKQARIAAMRKNRIKTSANSLPDYEYLSRQVPGVVRAKAFNTNNIITIQIIPAEAGLPTTALKNLVLANLTPRKNARHTVSIVDPKYVYVDVTMEVTPAASYSFTNDIKPAVLEVIQDFLHPLTTTDDALYYQNGWGILLKKAVLTTKVMNLRNGALVSNAEITLFKRSNKISGTSDIQLAQNEVSHVGVIRVINMNVTEEIQPGEGVGVSGVITMPKIAGMIG